MKALFLGALGRGAISESRGDSSGGTGNNRKFAVEYTGGRTFLVLCRRMISRLDAYAFGGHLVPNEHIVAVLHRHWTIAVLPMLRALLVGLVLPPVFLYAFWGPWWVAIVFIVWLALGALYIHHTFFDWFSDVFIVTNRGLLRIDWKSPFRVNSERSDLSSIDTVEYTRKGFFATLFSFGELIVVTANSSHTLGTIHHPRNARDLLSRERDRARTGLYGGLNHEADDKEEEAAPSRTPDVDTLRTALRTLLTEDFGLSAKHTPPADPNSPTLPTVNDVRPPAPPK